MGMGVRGMGWGWGRRLWGRGGDEDIVTGMGWGRGPYLLPVQLSSPYALINLI